MIHICFGLHDADGKYSKFVGATMASIFENTAAPVTIHILHDDTLTADNRDKFSYLAGKYSQAVKFHNVEELCPDEMKFLREKLADKLNLRFSIGAFYRLLIKKILRSGKAIYLDADIICNLDITELWRSDMKNFPVAAVPEIKATLAYIKQNKFLFKSGRVQIEDYFCSGVMIFNLDALDENFFYDGVQFLAENPQCESPDQDILNAFFAANYLKLEQKFDSFALAEKLDNFHVAQKIYHYAGNGIGLDLSDEYSRLWLEYFSRTPWFSVEIIDKLGKLLRETHEKNLSHVQQMMRTFAGHNRAFFVEPRNIPVLKDFFAVQDDEPIIEIRGQNSLDGLVAKMKALRGQKLFFLFYFDWYALKNFLTAQGFTEDSDFVDGRSYLTPQQGGYFFNEYALIKLL